MTAVRVAFQGEPGAYSEEAVIGYFGAGAAEPVPTATFSAACLAVTDGSCAAAMLPVENSIAGSVGEAIDALVRTDLRVVGEALLPIRHHLLGAPGATLDGIASVASHRQALAQCEAYLARSGWTLIPTEDTAGAARELAASGDRSRAVIASRRAADRYDLQVLTDALHVQDGNMTRFVVVAPAGAELPPASGALAPPMDAPPVSLIIFETLHVAGALHRALGALAEAGVNLSRIESRPTGRERWQFWFLARVDGDATVDPLRSALDELERRAHGVRVLGTFPDAG